MRSKKKSYSVPDFLSTQPDGILQNVIGPFLNPHDKARLRGASRFFNRQFNGEGLLRAVVYGDFATVRVILAHDQNDDLLLKAYTVTDLSGRRIHQTAYQAALAAEDEEMAVVIKERLLKQFDGDKRVRQQQADLFPPMEENTWECQKQLDMDALNTVIEVIRQSTVDPADDWKKMPLMDARCVQALMNFRAHLDACRDRVIKTGLHWNADLLQQAFYRYIRHYVEFGGASNSPKNILLWRCIIGYIQRFAPANYGQALAGGIFYKFERSFNFRLGGGSFFPLDVDPSRRLGIDVAALPGCGGQPSLGFAVLPGLSPQTIFSEFLLNKKERLDSCRTISPPSLLGFA